MVFRNQGQGLAQDIVFKTRYADYPWKAVTTGNPPVSRPNIYPLLSSFCMSCADSDIASRKSFLILFNTGSTFQKLMKFFGMQN